MDEVKGFTEIAVLIGHEAMDAVVDFFISAGTGGVATEEAAASDVWVKAYVRPPAEASLIDALRGRLAEAEAAGLQVGPGEVITRFVPDADWANEWRKHYHVQRVGRRLVIRPSWEEHIPAPDDVVIQLDPGMAFGTGSHPTTLLCLEALERVVEGGERVADIGTGSGILAIAAALLGAERVEAFDIQDEAIDAAQENAARNGVDSKVQVEKKPVEALGDEKRGPFDLIVMNIVADVIIPALPTLRRLAHSKSQVLLSGIIEGRADDVRQALGDEGFRVVDERRMGEWVLFQSALAGEER